MAASRREADRPAGQVRAGRLEADRYACRPRRTGSHTPRAKRQLKRYPRRSRGFFLSIVVANPDSLGSPRRARPAPATVVIVAVSGIHGRAGEEEPGVAMMMSVMPTLPPAGRPSPFSSHVRDPGAHGIAHRNGCACTHCTADGTAHAPM